MPRATICPRPRRRVRLVSSALLALLCRAFSADDFEQSALCALLCATDVDDYFSSWQCTACTSPTTPVCSWERVYCDSAGNIIEIDLKPEVVSGIGGDAIVFSYAIVGSIPKKIGLLRHLETLDLSFNSFDGIIPSEIGMLSKLEIFELSGNSIGGTIPSTVGSLSELQYFSVYDNLISGEIPSAMFQLSLLNHLSLGANGMTGSVPASIALLPNLDYLDLSDNSFTGPMTFFSSQSLVYVNATSNYFFSIPDPNITSAADIPYFKLEVALLDDNLLQELPHLVDDRLNLALRVLTASENNFTDFRFPDLSHLTSLTTLICKKCGLTSIPTFLGSLSSLLHLDISDNSLSVEMPSQFGIWHPQMHYLAMSNTGLRGTIPQSIASLTKLKYLYLSDNDLSGNVPISLCDVTTLSDFDISGNKGFGCFYQCLTATNFIHDERSVHCHGAYDNAMCDLAAALNIAEKVANEINVGDPVTFESQHPRTHGSESSQEYSITFDDATIKQFQIIFDAETDLWNEIVSVCTDSTCSTLLGRFGGHLGTGFPGVGGLPLLNIKQSSLYIKVAELNQSTSTEWGFSMHISVTSAGSGWECSTLENGTSYADGLCEDEWTGVTCLYGTQVQTIDLSGLDLTGKLPSTLGTLDRLKTLDLSYNSISGTIPVGLFYAENIESIDFSVNQLTGTLPSVLASSDQLQFLYELSLGVNKLSGSLPTFPLDIPFLQKATFDNNQFSGDMSDLYCDIDTNYETISLSNNRDLCYSDCWTALNPADESRCTNGLASSAKGLANDLIIVTAVCGLMILLLLGMVYFLMRRPRHLPVGVDDAEKLRRLDELPVHRAIVTGKSESAVMSAVMEHKQSAKERDYDGYTAIDLIIHSKSALQNVNADILFELVNNSLPFDSKTGEKIDDPEYHVFAWPTLVGTSEAKWVEVVGMILAKYKVFIEQFVDSCDAQGRRSIDIATPVCKEMMTRLRLLHGRYEINTGPPQHISKTCCVRLAVFHDLDKKTSDQKVALKFMRSREAFLREVNIRHTSDFDPRFVIDTYDVYDGTSASENDVQFRDDAILKGYEEYPYCVVMEAGDFTVQNVVFHQNMSGNDWDEIKRLLKHIILSVQHIHSRGVIHGDLKPMNIVLVNGRPQLIDFDASVNVDKLQYAGAKFSTAYCAPELLWESKPQKGFRRGTILSRSLDFVTNDSCSSTGVTGAGEVYSLAPAAYSMDMWSIGAILYLLCTGCTLFLATVEDDIYDSDDLERLYDWTPAMKARKLSSISNAAAKNLCSMLLTKDPLRRPSCTQILSHAFFTGRIPTRFSDGRKAKYDVFISYRVNSDRALAAAVYQELMQRELNVWMDVHNLPPGMNWEEGFCSGLVDSAFMVCIVSREAINSSAVESKQNVAKLQSNSPCDNLVLEWRLALELQERKLLQGIFPILVGDYKEDNSFGDYFRESCAPQFYSDIVVASVESKLNHHLEREGLGLPYKEDLSVKSVVGSILLNQGAFIRGAYDTAMLDIVSQIQSMVQGHSQKLADESGPKGEISNTHRASEFPSNLTAETYVQLLQEKTAEIKNLQEQLIDLQKLHGQ